MKLSGVGTALSADWRRPARRYIVAYDVRDPGPISAVVYFATAVNGVLASVVPHISASRPPSFFMSRNVHVS